MNRKVNHGNWLFIYFFAALFVIFVSFWWLNYINTTPDIKIKNPKAPNPNAYDYYFAATKSLVDKNKISFAYNKRPLGWKNTSWSYDRYYSLAEKEEIVKKNAAALKTFRDGFNYEYLDPLIRKSYPETVQVFAVYANFNSLDNLIILESQVYEKKGNYKSAVNSCIDAIHFGTDTYKGSGLSGFLGNFRIEVIALSDAANYINYLNAKDTKLVAKRLENILNHKYTLAQIYEDEKKFGLKLLLYIIDHNDWRLELIGGVWNWKSIFTSPRHTYSFIKLHKISNRRIFDNYINYMDMVIDSCKKPYSAKSPDIPLPNDPINGGYHPIIVRNFQINYEKSSVLERFLLLQLALRAYKLENGKYPNSLSELAPKYLAKVPLDPFGGSKTFIYNRIDNKYILYSLGPDCKDDGGKPVVTTQYIDKNSKGDIVFGVNKII